jgi:acetyl esterase/lipase
VPTHAYDAAATYPINETDREYLRHGDTPFLARIYQPDGAGPFPILLSVHGGAWNLGDRLQMDLISREMAASGMVVASVDFRLAPDGPYPAQVQDVHYAARWLKAHAEELNADPETMGIVGGSSGGHTALLCALRPRDERYAALPLEGAPDLDDGFRFAIACWSVLDPWSRYEFARTTPEAGGGFGGAEQKLRQTLNYFQNEPAIHEGNPQEILEREDAQALPPVLIIQGTEDMNIPLTSPQRFAPAYRALGGTVRVEWFPGEPHGFASRPGPGSTRAIAIMKDFVSTCIGQPVPA